MKIVAIAATGVLDIVATQGDVGIVILLNFNLEQLFSGRAWTSVSFKLHFRVFPVFSNASRRKNICFQSGRLTTSRTSSHICGLSLPSAVVSLSMLYVCNYAVSSGHRTTVFTENDITHSSWKLSDSR